LVAVAKKPFADTSVALVRYLVMVAAGVAEQRRIQAAVYFSQDARQAVVVRRGIRQTAQMVATRTTAVVEVIPSPVTVATQATQAILAVTEALACIAGLLALVQEEAVKAYMVLV
jgi:hypothetical protein